MDRKEQIKIFFSGSMFWKILLVISLLIMVVSGVRIFQLSREYSEGIEEYATLQEKVVVKDVEIKENVTNEKEEETQAKDIQVESAINIDVSVNYQELKAINEDFIGWLYYEPLELSYPIARGNDNEYYTHYTFEKNENSSGAIFMDFLNKPDMSDYNTIIYGHNMRNGSMFGSLKKLLNEKEIIQENPYFYILTENKKLKYEIFSCYITQQDSDTFMIVRDQDKQKEYLEYIKEQADFLNNITVTNENRIVTLSTCNGLHSTNRTIIHGVLVAEEDN